MARNPRRQQARLRELYEKVPSIPDCKGLCDDSCGPIDCSILEREIVERRSGLKLEAKPVSCSMLTPLGRCSVYDDRPMICRLFGTTRKMRCEHGCTPERWLSDEEFFDLLCDAMEVGGPPEGMEIDRLRRVMTSKAAGEAVATMALALSLVRSTKSSPLTASLRDEAYKALRDLGAIDPD